MKNEIIKLKSGYELTVKGIQIKETYPDILVGKYLFVDNYKIYENLSCPKDWGVAKCILRMDDFILLKPFKPYTVWVWLQADKPVNDKKGKFDYSELALIFTVDSIFDFSVEKNVKDVLKEINWEEYAVNLRF